MTSIRKAQALGMGVLLVATLGHLAIGTPGEADQGNAAHRFIRQMEGHLREANMGANDYVSSFQDTDRARFDHGIGAARADEQAVLEAEPALGAVVAHVDAAIVDMASAADAIWSQESPLARVDLMRAFDQRADEVEAQMSELDGMATQIGSAEQRRHDLVLSGATAFACLFFFVSDQLARRRKSVDLEQAEAVQTRARLQALDALRAAQFGAPLPATSGVPETAEVEEAIRVVAAELDSLRASSRDSERWSAFSRDLDAALDMADDEATVYSVAERAADVAFAGSAFQLWLSDNSFSELHPKCDEGPRVCRCDRPHNCPAIRRSRVETHVPGAGLARCPHLLGEDVGVTCSFVAIGGRAAGTLQLVDHELGAPQVEALRLLSTSLGARLTHLRAQGETELQASTDVLTGLLNRRSMNRALEELDRKAEPYCVISADLDHFKNLNDTYGHDVGDRCLRVFGQVLRDHVRARDMAFRPGGEEFCVVLPGAPIDVCMERAEQIRAATEESSRQMGIAFTVSLGVAARPTHGDDAETVLRAADQALYGAKDDGRNRVVRFQARAVLGEVG